MAKKKKTEKKTMSFQSSPFSDLKGFAVSASKPEEPAKPIEDEPVAPEEPVGDLFAREMGMLGVERLNDEGFDEENIPEPEESLVEQEPLTDDEEFLAAMGEMRVRFEDHLPEEDGPQQASPRRMKLLKQGRLQPEATLDLHGLLRHQVVEKVRFFLQGGKFQGCRTLLIITGRGLHSQGEPVLRNEVERFLRGEGRQLIAEWARAPRQYGGEGALVVFLKG